MPKAGGRQYPPQTTVRCTAGRVLEQLHVAYRCPALSRRCRAVLRRGHRVRRHFAGWSMLMCSVAALSGMPAPLLPHVFLTGLPLRWSKGKRASTFKAEIRVENANEGRCACGCESFVA